MAEQDNSMDFWCMTCGSRFERMLFDVSRAQEKVHFYEGGRVPEVETVYAEGIGVYCSSECRAIGLSGLMSAERVPLPAVPPGIGPVELCARCNGPVDMTTSHITYSQCAVAFDGCVAAVHTFDYLAVVCKNCTLGVEEGAVSVADATSSLVVE